MKFGHFFHYNNEINNVIFSIILISAVAFLALISQTQACCGVSYSVIVLENILTLYGSNTPVGLESMQFTQK